MTKIRSKHPNWWFIPALMVIPLIICSTWVADDAFIPIRSIEQVFAGNGLVWNPGERAQVFTSPLWFGICLTGRLLIHNPWWMLIVLGMMGAVVCAIQAAHATNHHRSRELRLIIATILASSTAGIFDFLACGLENPLYFLLIGGIILKAKPLLENQLPSKDNLLAASTLTGLLAITRHDQMLLIAPLMGLWWFHGAWERLREARGFYTQGYPIPTLLASAILATMPLIAWTTFSTIWFGVPLPNTAYAKLAHGIPQNELWITGINYTINSLIEEPMLWIIILLGIKTIISKKSPWKWSLLLGIALYYTYTLKIGGDYMTGRFFGGPAWLCLIAWLQWGPEFTTKWTASKFWKLPIAGALAAFTILAFYPERVLGNNKQKKITCDSASLNTLIGYNMGDIELLPTSPNPIYIWGFRKQAKIAEKGNHPRFDIANEMCVYRKTSGFLKWWWPNDSPLKNGPNRCVTFGFLVENIKTIRPDSKIYYCHTAGGFPFLMGVDKYCIDLLAITSPFYSRQPADRITWRPGHAMRDKVPGFEESIESEENLIKSPREHQLFNDIYWMTRSPDLWAPERWKVIRRYFFDPYGGLGPGKPHTKS